MADENWYLRTVTQGIEPCHEANTSRYVQEVLLQCLRWPMEQIQPQASRRGFIDYTLLFPHGSAGIHVEVKRFGVSLKDTYIRKYLVRRGPNSDDLRVGVLTNLREWWIYVAGSRIRTAAGVPMVRIKEVVVQRRADIAELYGLIGYRQNGRCKNVRAALGESPAVLRHLMGHDPEVLTAIRKQLDERTDGRIPPYERLKDMMHAIMNGDGSHRGHFSQSTLLKALRSWMVAEVANQRLVRLFGARSRSGKVRKAIKALLAKQARLNTSERSAA